MKDPNLEWLEREFERCWPMLERAVRKMKQAYGRDFVWDQLASEKAQLWPGMESVVVTTIEVLANGEKRLFGWLGAGDWQELNLLRERSEAWGKGMGCSHVQCIQRNGMGRRGRPMPGYRQIAVVMEKVL